MAYGTVVANPGAGGAEFAEDTIAGAVFPRSKITLGGEGVNEGDVSTTNPMPVDGSGVTQPVSAASLPLPTGAATAAKQPALGTAGASSADVLSVQGIASGTALPVSAAALPLPSGASTAAKQPALGTAGTASADVITVQGIASMTALKVDGSAVTQPVSGTVTASNVTGNVASDSADSGNPVKIGMHARTSDLTAVANADRVDAIATVGGKQITLPFALPELSWTANPAAITDNSAHTVKSADASLRHYVTSLTVTNSHATVGTLVTLRDGSGGTTMWQGYAAAVGGGVAITFPVPLRGTAATLIEAICGTTGSNIYVSMQGYSAP